MWPDPLRWHKSARLHAESTYSPPLQISSIQVHDTSQSCRQERKKARRIEN